MADFYDASPRPRGFNTAEGRSSFDATKRELAARVEQVCRHLLPSGRRNGQEWEAGDTAGNKGKSLKVHLTGDKAGVWQDFATGDTGDLLDLWSSVKGVKLPEAKEDAERWLGKAQAAPRPAWANAIPEATPKSTQLPRPDKEWTYYTSDGEVFCRVHRIDRPGQAKIVKPVLPDRSAYGKPGEPKLAPLLNLPEIIRAPEAVVVLVEGEKCVDAMAGMVEGCVPTTMIGGSGAAKHADWSSLRGRHVVRWPDKDAAGVKWLASTLEALKAAGVASVRDVVPLPDWPDGEDAADRSDGERRYYLKQALAADPVYTRPVSERVTEQTLEFAYEGDVPEIEWLVDGLFQHGRGGMFAAAGGTGKGFLLLDMAVKVASIPHAGYDAAPPLVLGHQVKRHGRVVLLSAEDARDEIHRRSREMHPSLARDVLRRIHPRPYPDMIGKTPHLFIEKDNELRPTEEYTELMADLKAMDGLELVIMDPLQAFFAADLTTNVMSQNVAHIVDQMAIELGCTVIAAHHMTKGDRNKPVRTASDARNAIQGAAQLMSAVRWAYAIWPEEESRARVVSQAMGVPPEKYHDSLVFRGGIVKTNTRTSTEVSTFIRGNTGLLEYVPASKVREELEADEEVPVDMTELVVHAIKHLSSTGHPPTVLSIMDRSGTKVGAGDWLQYMPPPWRSFKETKRRTRVLFLNKLDKAGVIKITNGFVHMPGDQWTDDNLKTDRRAGEPVAVPWPIPVGDDA
jgi:hypothetical protein